VGMSRTTRTSRTGITEEISAHQKEGIIPAICSFPDYSGITLEHLVLLPISIPGASISGIDAAFRKSLISQIGSSHRLSDKIKIHAKGDPALPGCCVIV
jgi:hypothetical protein